MRKLGQRSNGRTAAPELNLAPLMDMVFILLIFFVVTTVFVEETGVDVERPSAMSARSLEKQSILVGLTADGRILFGGREYALNGLRGLVRRELAEEESPVILLVDKATPSGLLIDVMDECKLAGAKSVSVAARREK